MIYINVDITQIVILIYTNPLISFYICNDGRLRKFLTQYRENIFLFSLQYNLQGTDINKQR